MVPALRFLLGGALAALLLALTIFGLAATVRLAQETKVSPLQPPRTLAYAAPAGWTDLFKAEIRGRSEGDDELGSDGNDRIDRDETLIPRRESDGRIRPEEGDRATPPIEVRRPTDVGLEHAPTSDTPSIIELEPPPRVEEMVASIPPPNGAAAATAVASDQSAVVQRSSETAEPQPTTDPQPTVTARAKDTASEGCTPSAVSPDRSEHAVEPRHPSDRAGGASAPADIKPTGPGAPGK